MPKHMAGAYCDSREKYDQLYRSSINDPEEFWAKIAKSFFWKQPWSKVPLIPLKIPTCMGRLLKTMARCVAIAMQTAYIDHFQFLLHHQQLSILLT